MEQSWVYGLLGGLTIGGAASVYLLMNGRIMGASGILGGLVDGSGRNTWRERATFLLGLIAVPGLVALMIGAPETHITSNAWILISAGILVGLGTRFARGCTSGHGVCGISRLSLRGMVATVFYLLAGGLSIVVFKHILGVI
ncbi:YeeE/YedE family protein [Parasedimentitalea psychrophila]|uniref:YeeE/YedE thiosulfate transporter family protein n=1 Tax=Parasedimentitalea psychrophila TaxID=2997337 RepID=A0A9Y2L2L6_9RHOB|nr:YeeE/YedE thiosulfate transporter family protein [Parasedimentitalea psychrophila]WIY27605.1 YeeE/YedE thiosulfate transporter family protein [Parasedimentitalea psychrophila]